MTKSPLTGIFAESYSGGKAFQPMSRIGYDAFVLEGALSEWGYLEISAEGVAFPSRYWQEGRVEHRQFDELLADYRRLRGISDLSEGIWQMSRRNPARLEY